MVPNDHCKPACPDGSLCCRDADTPPPGYCLTVKSCSQVLSSDALSPRRTAWTPSPFDVGDEVAVRAREVGVYVVGQVSDFAR